MRRSKAVSDLGGTDGSLLNFAAAKHLVELIKTVG